MIAPHLHAHPPIFRSHDPRERVRGFSIFETLVTAFVVGVLASVGIPTLQAVLAEQAIVTASNTLVAALHLARSEAIKRNQNVILCPSADGRTCGDPGNSQAVYHMGYMVFVDQNPDHQYDDSEPVVRRFDSPSNVQIFGSRAHDMTTYHPAGHAYVSTNTFWICHAHGNSRTRKVVLSNGGRPRIELTTDPCPTAGP